MLATIMRKKLIILAVGFLLIACGTKKNLNKTPELENGWYFITEQKANSTPLTDRFTGEMIFIESLPILKASESSTFEIQKNNWGTDNYEFIQLIFEGKAKQSWADATERMSRTNEKAAFIYKDEVISIVGTFQKIDNGYSPIVNKDFTTEILNEIISELKPEK